MSITKNIGFLLLSIWLILSGAVALLDITQIPQLVFSVLALVSGIFILIGR